MKVYQRTVNGRVTEVSQVDGRNEINTAMMSARSRVKTMSSINRTDFHIEYRTGDVVELRLVEKTEDAPETAEIGPGQVGRVVVVKGKKYVLNNRLTQRHTIPAHTTRGYSYPERTVPGQVTYWTVRNGKAFGPVRTALDTAKPGNVGHALWNAALDHANEGVV